VPQVRCVLHVYAQIPLVAIVGVFQYILRIFFFQLDSMCLSVMRRDSQYHDFLMIVLVVV
jgi:hypothetical protein